MAKLNFITTRANPCLSPKDTRDRLLQTPDPKMGRRLWKTDRWMNNYIGNAVFLYGKSYKITNVYIIRGVEYEVQVTFAT